MILFNKKTPIISTIIVNALPKLNFQNSVSFSLIVIACELNTNLRFVKYANNTQTIIPIVLAMFPSTWKNAFSTYEVAIFTMVVKTPNMM